MNLCKEHQPHLYNFLKRLWMLGLSIWYTLKEAFKNKLNIHASSCTYYFLVSLVPILILAGWGALSAAKRPEVTAVLESITLYNEVMNFVRNMGITIPKVRFAFSIVGLFSILYALWSASALMRGIALAFRAVFNSDNRRKNIVITFAAYFFIPLFLISAIIFVTLSNALAKGIKWVLSDMLQLLNSSEITAMFAPVVTYIFIWMAALLAFMLLSPKRPGVWAALTGSFIFGVYFFLLQNVVMSMMANLISRYAVYGALGTLLLILLWAYLVFFGLFIIAQYTAIIDNFNNYYRYHSFYTLLKTHHNILEQYTMMQLPFAQDEHLRFLAKGNEISAEKISLIKVYFGSVLIEGMTQPLQEGEYRLLSAANINLTALQDSKLLLLDEKEHRILLKTHPGIWEEIG